MWCTIVRAKNIFESMLIKADLRRHLLAARNAIPMEQRRHADAAIGARTVAWCRDHRIHLLGVYWPIRSEPDLRPAYAELAASGVRLALPVVIERDAPLQFAEWSDDAALTKDAMGMTVPAPPQRFVRPQALLIPCVGFNADRVRLGFGGGYYDRTLENTPRPLTIGIAYAVSQAEFNAAPHDVALDVIVTEYASIGG
jgi:5-formyltetrahydrofolate cyclo-ligase